MNEDRIREILEECFDIGYDEDLETTKEALDKAVQELSALIPDKFRVKSILGKVLIGKSGFYWEDVEKLADAICGKDIMTKKELKEILHNCKYGKCGLEEAEEIIGRELDKKISEEDIVDVLNDISPYSFKTWELYYRAVAKAIIERIKGE